MPAKKNKKTKVVKKISLPKKIAAKKAAVKKSPAKKIPAKKIISKKSTAKPVKKQKKISSKIIKKPAKKLIEKAALKKIKIEKIVKAPQKKSKEKEIKKEEVKKPAATKSLAKTILAKHSTKTGKPTRAEAEAEKAPAPKNEALQRAIIVRKSDGKNKTNFKIGDFAIYPSHGIGKIVEIEKTIILNQEFKCYLMYFEKEKLTIKIPMNSADKIGLRHLISKEQMDEVFVILRSGVKKLKGMWSRRAQEYETKINSGDIILLAEVLRDLTRDIEDSERSYSERIIYETAIHRLASEYSAIYGTPFEEAKDKIITIAKDKLSSETRVAQKDEFDEFDVDAEESDSEDDEENEDEDDEDEEDDDFDYDDEDDDAPKKKKRKK